MSGRSWSTWVGAPLAVLAVALVFSQFQAGAEAGGRATARAPGACEGGPKLDATAEAGRGTWWRLADRLDGDGTLVGRTLFIGRAKATSLTMGLGVESMASGPIGGLVVVTSDDGRFSDVRLVSAAKGCSWLIHRADDVVRSAILDGSSGTLFAHLVRRETREDLGTWRITGVLPDAALTQVLEPLPAQPGLGQIWATELRLDGRGTSLAVQSCSAAGCITRALGLGGFGAPPTLVGGPGQGSIIGLSGHRLITWAHCAGLPCGIQAWTAGAAEPDTLVQLAAGAGLTGDGRYLVAVLDETGRASRVDLETGQAQRIQGVLAGDLPLGIGLRAYAGLEVGPDEIALGAEGTDAHAFSPGSAVVSP